MCDAVAIGAPLGSHGTGEACPYKGKGQYQPQMQAGSG
jgi:hypothetical protein